MRLPRNRAYYLPWRLPDRLSPRILRLTPSQFQRITRIVPRFISLYSPLRSPNASPRRTHMSASHSTNLDSNKQLVARWFEEVWNQSRRETIFELFAPEAV